MKEIVDIDLSFTPSVNHDDDDDLDFSTVVNSLNVNDYVIAKILIIFVQKTVSGPDCYNNIEIDIKKIIQNEKNLFVFPELEDVPSVSVNDKKKKILASYL